MDDMSCICEVIGKEVPIHRELRDILLESMDMLSKSSSNHLNSYALARTFSQIKTIKGISELILGIEKTTVIKNIQELVKIDDFLFKQLTYLTRISDVRRKYTAIIDPTLLQRFSNKVLYAKNRWNWVKNCFIIAQEEINCCLHTDRGVYTILTEIKANKKKTEIYREFIEKLFKKM